MMLIKEELIDIIGLMEIDLDFAEENIEVASKTEISSRLRKIEDNLHLLGSSYNYARLLDSGIHLTLVGESNAGKSTLLNQLLGENRAITSHIPGTTRDTIQENIVINDILFSLVDTAGLRESRDELEREGIKRTKSQALRSDMVLLIVDASLNISALSWELIQDTTNWIQAPVIIVANKTDAGIKQETIEKLKKLNKPIVRMSAKTGKGLKNLEEVIVKTISKGYDAVSDDVIITSKRQKEIIDKTTEHINQACTTLEKNSGFEFAAVDLRQALDILGELTGETVTDDILNNIFGRFCIGK
jgi:tRNA modification GTPase